MKLIVRCDLPALRRGHTFEGETCDIVGFGPIPVADARALLAEDPFVAAVITQGTDVRAVTHLGRQATAAMRTALEWADVGCSVLGCPNEAHLEIDHSLDWALTRHTRLDELDLLCRRHHRLKTHDGHRLEPGTGKRHLLAPDERTPEPEAEVGARRSGDPGSGPGPSAVGGEATSTPRRRPARDPDRRSPARTARTRRSDPHDQLPLPNAS